MTLRRSQMKDSSPIHTLIHTHGQDRGLGLGHRFFLTHTFIFSFLTRIILTILTIRGKNEGFPAARKASFLF